MKLLYYSSDFFLLFFCWCWCVLEYGKYYRNMNQMRQFRISLLIIHSNESVAIYFSVFFVGFFF